MASPDGNNPSRLKPRSLRVGFFNLNGLRGQRAKLSDFVRDHKLDVFLLQETFLKPSQRSPKLPNFNLVRNDRTKGPKGGTLIYYKRSLHCIPLDPPESVSNIEASVCRLSMTGHPPITLISAYLSPSKELHSNELVTLLSMGESVLLAGDLNAKNTLWNCNCTNGRGAALESCLDEIDMSILVPSEPTHYSFIDDSYRPDILDIALVRNVCLNVRSLRVLHELDSDHRPVILDLAPHNGPLTQVLTISSERVPETGNGQGQLPDDVRWVLRRRNAALKACVSDPSPDRRRLARYLQREARRRIQEAVDSRWEQHLSEIKPTHTAFWKLSQSSLASTHVDHDHLVAVDTFVESRNAILPPPIPRPFQTIDPDVDAPLDSLAPVTIEEVVALIKAAADQLGEWFRKWRITVNSSKSQAILFYRKFQKEAPNASVRLSGQIIPWTSKVKWVCTLIRG
ncbi:uncharacterized protein LOC119190705 [Manduca sexta]|uniref:uncharacterized protein LOC119190705 n=1 Tax=Manduca sexta TaxID=7130 RepID=UPI00188FD112|nr:uncharacterized protein LOC119190705 [Manduca sexta]